MKIKDIMIGGYYVKNDGDVIVVQGFDRGDVQYYNPLRGSGGDVTTEDFLKYAAKRKAKPFEVYRVTGTSVH